MQADLPPAPVNQPPAAPSQAIADAVLRRMEQLSGQARPGPARGLGQTSTDTSTTGNGNGRKPFNWKIGLGLVGLTLVSAGLGAFVTYKYIAKKADDETEPESEPDEENEEPEEEEDESDE